MATTMYCLKNLWLKSVNHVHIQHYDFTKSAWLDIPSECIQCHTGSTDFQKPLYCEHSQCGIGHSKSKFDRATFHLKRIKK